MPSKEIITMQNELKPCPFCGAIPSLRQMKSTKEYYLFCRKCCIETTGFTDKNEIIKYWNTRFNENNHVNSVSSCQQNNCKECQYYKEHQEYECLPYDIGDTVYCVNGYGSQRYIEEFTVAEIRITKDGIWLTDTKGMEWLARVCHFSRDSAERELRGNK